jgi:hypothetical protein
MLAYATARSAHITVEMTKRQWKINCYNMPQTNEYS